MFRKFIITCVAAVMLYATVVSVSPSKEYLSASFHGVVVANSEIIADDYNGAILALDAQLQSKVGLPVHLVIDGRATEFSAEDLGVSFDTYKTAEKVYKANERFGFLKSLYKAKVDPVVNVNIDKLYESIGLHVKGLDGGRDATVEVAASGVYVSAHTDGRKFDEAKVVDDIVAALINESVVQVVVDTIVVPAEYNSVQARIDASLMSKIYDESLGLVYSDDSETFTVELILDSELVYVKNGVYIFDELAIGTYITEHISSVFDVNRQDAIIRSLPLGENLQAEVEGFARNGRIIDLESSIDAVKVSIINNESVAIMKVFEEDARIINETGIDLGDLKLLAVGRSNFAGSSAGRARNVTFGLEEKFNNVLLSPDGEFSAIANSGKNISVSNGWSMAKVILGGEIVNGVGGGLCQASTTMYRAALNAGMDITFKKAHSVYVSYYSEHGDGLDAAIFNSNGLDFKFKNTTPDYVLIQAEVIGEDAYVNFYGTDDGRQVEMFGPFYGRDNSNPHELISDLRSNQIGWVRKITAANGLVTNEPIISSYMGMPRK